MYPSFQQWQPSSKRVVSFTSNVEVIVTPGSDQWRLWSYIRKTILHVITTNLSKHLLALQGPVVDAILAAGRAGSSHTQCPLMYQWHGTRYWGAAHGLAGIMHVLLHFPLNEEDADDVKGTLRYMIKGRFSSGNYPSSEGNARDRLIHWCHGAPGIAMTLCKAAQVCANFACTLMQLYFGLNWSFSSWAMVCNMVTQPNMNTEPTSTQVEGETSFQNAILTHSRVSHLRDLGRM